MKIDNGVLVISTWELNEMGFLDKVLGIKKYPSIEISHLAMIHLTLGEVKNLGMGVINPVVICEHGEYEMECVIKGCHNSPKNKEQATLNKKRRLHV